MSSIATRASWGAQHRNGVGDRGVGRLEKYLHHTVTAHLSASATVAQERAQMQNIERIGQQRFGAGISYTFVIFPSGRIYQGASTGRIAYHSGPGRNTRGAGVCLAGNYDQHKLGIPAFDALVWLLQHGVERGWWGDPALTSAHRDFSSTACPGRHAYGRFAAINKAGRGQSAPKPTPSPEPSPSPRAWPDVALPARDSHNTASHRAWVKLMADVGYTDSSLTVAIQKWLRSFGKYNVGPADGVFGPRTTRALQSFLVDRGHLPNSAYVDGDRGPVTVRAEVDYLNSQRQYYS